MALTKKQLKEIKKQLDNCKKPLIFFHDDPDGVCSFIQFYSYIGDGKGVIVKSRPLIDMKFLRKVQEYEPDKIIVLDIAQMEQDFVAQAAAPILWIDHHGPQEIHDVKYFNPRLSNPKDNSCVSQITYDAVKKNLWIAAVGTVGDMQWPKKTDK